MRYAGGPFVAESARRNGNWRGCRGGIGALSGSLTDYGINDDFVSCLFSMWFAFTMFWLLNTKKTVTIVITRMVTNF
jgi:hypothetical protein